MLDIETSLTQAVVHPLSVVRRLGEFSSDAIIATDAAGVLAYANRKTTDLFGWTEEELVGKSISLLIPGRFHNSHEHHVRDFAHGGEINRHLNPTELVGVGADGREFPVAVALSRVEGTGEPVLYASIRDITVQVESARALAANERRLKGIFDGAAVALWEQDFTAVGEWLESLRMSGVGDLGAFLETHPEAVDHGASLIATRSVNPAGQALDTIVKRGDGLENLASAEAGTGLRPTLAAQFRAVWDGVGHVQTDLVARETETETRHLVVHWDAAACGETDSGTPDLSSVIVSMVDITQRVAAQQHVATMEIQLRQAQKLEAIGQLAAGVAHEINTPIQYVSDNAGFLRDSFETLQGVHQAADAALRSATDGVIPHELVDHALAVAGDADYEFLTEEIPDAFAELLDGVQRVATIVAALKKFSHPGTDEKLPENLNRIVEDSLSVSASEWKHHAIVVTDLDHDLPLVPCMAGEISQVVINIVVNAAHAIADQATQEPGEVAIRTGELESSVFVEIADNGPGIPEEIQERIFEPFFTTKDVGKGTGQGLALAHKIVVDQHQGSLLLESSLGSGAKFRIELPIGNPDERTSI